MSTSNRSSGRSRVRRGSKRTVTSCSPGGTSAGAVPEMRRAPDRRQDAGADLGHSAPANSIANDCGLYQIPRAVRPL